jgi:uncharacterized protein YacL
MNNKYFIIVTILIALFIAFIIIKKHAKLTNRQVYLGLFIGGIAGLIIGALLSGPLSHLPGIFGEWMPISVSVVSVLFAVILLWQQGEILDRIFEYFFRLFSVSRYLEKNHTENFGEIVLDTSVLIDGRIADVVSTGFLPQKIIIPQFVLSELQNIADSKDSDRREKGRRGFDTIEKIKKKKRNNVEIITDDFPEILEVDSKLLTLSKRKNISLVTTDYNLNKIAHASGVNVLNINELAQSLRPVLLPGEELEVKIIHTGKGKHQGIGYLADGTMIVVENGETLIDKMIKVKIVKALQTAAGKMFFARMVDED